MPVYTQYYNESNIGLFQPTLLTVTSDFKKLLQITKGINYTIPTNQIWNLEYGGKTENNITYTTDQRTIKFNLITFLHLF